MNTRKLFAFILSALLLSPSVLADRLFTDGAEQGASQLTTQWSANPNTAPTFVTTVPHSGTYHYRCSTSGSNCNVGRDLDSSVTSGTYFTRFYVRWATLQNATVSIWSQRSSGANTGMAIKFVTGSNILRVVNAAAATVDFTTTITTGIWYRVEIKTVIAASVGSWECNLFTGDSTIATETKSATGVDTLFNNFQRTLFGAYDAANTGDVYFDDIAINVSTGSFETGYPGPGKIFMLKPDGDSAAAWTRSTGTVNANNVDETPTAAPNDATDYNSDTGNTNVDRLTLTNLGAEVTSNATIRLVHAWLRSGCGAAGNCTTNSSKLLLRLWDEGGSSTDGPVISPPNTANAWAILTIAERLVYNAAGKTKANFDSFNAGYVGSGAGTDEKRVTALWLNVEWLEAAVASTSPRKSVVY